LCTVDPHAPTEEIKEVPCSKVWNKSDLFFRDVDKRMRWLLH
jgi:hypothetical protein